MRFSTVLAALATVGFAAATPLESRQEALRFGVVNVDAGAGPVAPGQTFEIRYDSSKARFHPLFVDFFVQGRFADTGNLTPRLLLSRNEFGADAVTLNSTATLPPVDKLGPTNSWLVWADVTFPVDGFVEVGGTSTGLAVQSA
ncbi:hypothetical protein Moror_7246 [Moniliophthora roreri MCA 2997]|uniref:Secreted protein n=1 Tax=Moniliophthora roreri (strain MCA 2997) TaxID=1381753 RepID=V2XTT0_MONRO|nr:hypothetical protein Moror_7246 [Moniliophthora roreri MCA 2997]